MNYPWLESYWQSLSDQYQHGYLPRALILSGVAGLGKRLLGKRLAQLILCNQQHSQPCGRCRQCHLFEALSHPDYQILEPEESSRIIKIEQVREVIDRLNQTPLIAAAHVVLIYPLECLTVKAANALLKTLEEPSGAVFFILIADHLTQIPATLLSRCSVYTIQMVHHERALQWVTTELSCTLMQAQVYWRLAYEAPLAVIELHKKNVLVYRNKLLTMMNDAMAGNNFLTNNDSLLKEYDDHWALLQTILNDVRKCHVGVAPDKWIHIDAEKQIRQLSERITPNNLQCQMNALLRVEKALALGIAINPKMALDSIILKGLA